MLCRSRARTQKEGAILRRQLEGLEHQRYQIDTALRRKPEPDLETLGRRIGRWQSQFRSAAKFLEAKVVHNPQGAASGLLVTRAQPKLQQAQSRHGAYLLRTHCTQEAPAQLWRWYIQLTQAEAAFRCANSDLHLRPIYPQKTQRVEAHILVCFLALALWRVLEQWMQGKGLGTCARKLLTQIRTLKSMDVIVPVRRGERSAELTARTVSRPEPHVAQLLQRLGITLPRRNRILDPEAKM